MDAQSAKKIVEQYLQPVEPGDNVFGIFDNKTVETAYGWVFYYNSKQYIETREMRHMLVGPTPLLVRHSGELVVLAFHTSLAAALTELNL